MERKEIKSKVGANVVTLAYGEVTGHSHSIYGVAKTKLYETEDKSINRLAVKEAEAALTHEEHCDIMLPTKEIDVFIQEEYDPEGEYRRVTD